MARLIIGVTGRMGSGKSTLRRVLEEHGFPGYDCDARAKAIMLTDEFSTVLAGLFGSDAILNGQLNKPFIASLIFEDAGLRHELESDLMPFLLRDFLLWESGTSSTAVVLESAIMFRSCLNLLCDIVYEVQVSDETRMARIKLRNPDWTDGQTAARLQAGEKDFPGAVSVSNEDGSESILPQLNLPLFGLA